MRRTCPHPPGLRPSEMWYSSHPPETGWWRSSFRTVSRWERARWLRPFRYWLPRPRKDTRICSVLSTQYGQRAMVPGTVDDRAPDSDIQTAFLLGIAYQVRISHVLDQSQTKCGRRYATGHVVG